MGLTGQVYLDYAATTPVDERVLEKMLPYFRQEFGNPSSIHAWGQAAEAALDEAREKVSAALGCRPEEIVFTSCGTESDNLALRGAALARRKKTGANHILISPVEHHAVAHTAQQLADELGNATLVTLEGRGHIATFQNRSKCADDIATAYFLKGEVPKVGTVCTDD